MESVENIEITEDIRQSEEYSTYMKMTGWDVIRISKLNLFLRRLAMFSICKVQRFKGEINIEQLEPILDKYRVCRVIVEPEEIHMKKGFRINRDPLLATKTVRVDLRPGEERIFGNFKKDCRYTLRKLSVSNYQLSMDKYGEFYQMWRESAKRLNIWIPREEDFNKFIKCFGNKVFCIIINGQAGAIIVLHEQTAFYYYAGATKAGTRVNLPYLVVWEAMKEAKRRGAKVWDFEGIFDERWPDKKWKGFSHFKKSFGGKEVEMPGSFSKWRWPFFAKATKGKPSLE